jgi:hypothetical protein
MSRNIFQIESGQLAFAVVDTTAVGYQGGWQAPGGKTLTNVALSDYNTASQNWSCQTTAGSLNATADTTTSDVPATFCEPGETIPTPAKSSYELAVTFLQDPNVSTGLNRFLFENDTAESYFMLGLNGANPPMAIGRVRLSSATIGGEARTTLTADITLPCSRKPDIEFGDATTSVIITGGDAVKGAAKPGDVFPAEPTVTASDSTNAAKLGPLGYVANPTTAWTTGQKITVGTYIFNWSGSAWAAGAHA